MPRVHEDASMDVLEAATLLFCCLYLVTGRFIGYVVFIKLMSVNERKCVLKLIVYCILLMSFHTDQDY